MVWLTALGALASTALLMWLRGRGNGIRRLTDGLGALAFFAVFAIGAESVMETLLHNTVFMTEVHQFLLNPVFLASGGPGG